MPPDAHALLLAAQRLHQLQVAVEKRLAACSVDSLTPHEAVEFIFKRRVRLVRIARNDFEDDGSGGEGDSRSASAGSASKLPSATPRGKAQRELVAHFQVGKERLTAVCRAEGPHGPDSRYSTELRPTWGKGSEVLLRCASWDQAACAADWAAWEALRGRFAVDLRPTVDFARSVVLLGVFAELQRRFAREESDSEDESPGLVSTISICGMMAAAALPTQEGRLLAAHVRDLAATPAEARPGGNLATEVRSGSQAGCAASD